MDLSPPQQRCDVSTAALMVAFTAPLNHLVTVHECHLLPPSCATSRWEAAEPAAAFHWGFAHSVCGWAGCERPSAGSAPQALHRTALGNTRRVRWSPPYSWDNLKQEVQGTPEITAAVFAVNSCDSFSRSVGLMSSIRVIHAHGGHSTSSQEQRSSVTSKRGTPGSVKSFRFPLPKIPKDHYLHLCSANTGNGTRRSQWPDPFRWKLNVFLNTCTTAFPVPSLCPEMSE